MRFASFLYLLFVCGCASQKCYSGLDNLVSQNPSIMNLARTTIEPSSVISTVDKYYDRVSRCLHGTGMWEEHISYLVRHLLLDACSQNGFVVDVGANLGWFTLLSAQMGCRVMAYEPQSRLLGNLTTTIALNGLQNRICVRDTAVSSKAELVQVHAFYFNEADFSGATIVPDSGGSVVDAGLMSACLDDEVHEPVNFLKVDVEGYGTNVMKGSWRVFKELGVQFVSLEFGGGHIKPEEGLAMLKEFEAMGYHFWSMTRGAGKAHGGSGHGMPMDRIIDLNEFVADRHECMARVWRLSGVVTDTYLCQDDIFMTKDLAAAEQAFVALTDHFLLRPQLESLVIQRKAATQRLVVSLTAQLSGEPDEQPTNILVFEGEDEERVMLGHCHRIDVVFPQCVEFLKSVQEHVNAAYARDPSLRRRIPEERVVFEELVEVAEGSGKLIKAVVRLRHNEDSALAAAEFCLRAMCSNISFQKILDRLSQASKNIQAPRSQAASPPPPPPPPPPAATTGEPQLQGFFGKRIFIRELHPATWDEIRHRTVEVGVDLVDYSPFTPDFKTNTLHELLDMDEGHCPNPNHVRREVWARLRAEMETVDAIIVDHPLSSAELYMPFNKPMLLLASVSLEQGRENPTRFKLWLENLLAIARDPRNIIVANSRFMVRYLEWFTGLNNILLVPPVADYADGVYQPIRHEILFGRWKSATIFKYVDIVNQVSTQLGANLTFGHYREYYPGRHSHQDFANHPAVVIIPYKTHIMSYSEYYNMGIPMFFPTIEFLLELQMNDEIFSEQVLWQDVPSLVSPASIAAHLANPNLLINDTSVAQQWLPFSEFFYWEHITFFSSWEDLVVKVKNADLPAIHRGMMDYQSRLKKEVQLQWQGILKHLTSGPRRPVPTGSLESALQATYGVSLPPDNLPCDRASIAGDYFDWQMRCRVAFVAKEVPQSEEVPVTMLAQRGQDLFQVGKEWCLSQSMGPLETCAQNAAKMLQDERNRFPDKAEIGVTVLLKKEKRSKLIIMETHRGEDIEAVARAFVQKNGLPESDIPDLIHRTQRQFDGASPWL